MADGPDGRHGFNANAGSYGGGAPTGGGGGYAAPAYGAGGGGGGPAGGYGGGYAAPSYGAGGGGAGGGADYGYGAYGGGTPDSYGQVSVQSTRTRRPHSRRAWNGPV